MSVANTLNNIGLVYNSKGEYDRALELYERANAIKIAVLGECTPVKCQMRQFDDHN